MTDQPQSKEVQDLIAAYQWHPEFLGDPIKDLHKRSIMGSTLLHLAVRQGNVRHVQQLIRSGLDVNIVADMGYSPLHDAVSVGRADIVSLLLAAGANTQLQNEFGATALSMAKSKKFHAIADLIKAKKK